MARQEPKNMKRIGILLDDLLVNQWQREIISFIKMHPELSLDAVLINKNDSKKAGSKLFYRVFQAIDRKIFKSPIDAFQKGKFEIPENTLVIPIKGLETKFSYKFSKEDIALIKNLDLDVLVRFGFGILKGEILETANYGLWSLHHGDNKINRGGPPGFWEIVEKEEVTGVTLQKLSSDLDGGKVIGKSFTKTNFTSFNRNKNEVFWSGVELFNWGLEVLANDRIPNYQTHEKSFYSKPLYKDPNNFESLKIHGSFWFRRIKEAVREFLLPPQWYLLYKFKKKEQNETSIFRFKKLLPPKGYDWADPFIIEVKEKGYYIFFEELKIKDGKGHISCLEFDKKGELKSGTPRKVIEEDFHLSYPFIFKEADTFYMIPESAQSGEVWIYECTNFPLKWEKKERIFKHKPIYDVTLFKQNDYYFLFGTEKIIEGNSRDQYLFIYFSKELFSDQWKAHPQNPVYRDVRRARPAGKIFEQNGKIIRPSQIGAPKYGYGIQFNEIIELSTTEFKEKKIDEILPDWEKGLLATHTFNSEGGFSVMDAQGIIH